MAVPPQVRGEAGETKGVSKAQVEYNRRRLEGLSKLEHNKCAQAASVPSLSISPSHPRRDPVRVVEGALSPEHGGVRVGLPTLSARRLCADCRLPLATWASINTGVFICQRCAGTHRGLGVHVSQARRTSADTSGLAGCRGGFDPTRRCAVAEARGDVMMGVGAGPEHGARRVDQLPSGAQHTRSSTSAASAAAVAARCSCVG